MRYLLLFDCLIVTLLSSLLLVHPSLAFAAAKKGGGNKKKKTHASSSSSSSFKGFGTQPPTYEEVVATFPTRQGINAAKTDKCPCGGGVTTTTTTSSSSRSSVDDVTTTTTTTTSSSSSVDDVLYGDCCALYHAGSKFAETPLRVLQTRYSAFYYRLIPYIIDTTHPICRDYCPDKIKWAKNLDKNGMFDSFDFVALQVIGSEGATATTIMEETEREAYLEFKVKLRARDGSDQETILSEQSRFLKQGDRWLYASGQVKSDLAGLEDTILNP